MHRDRGHQALKVVETIERRMDRGEQRPEAAVDPSRAQSMTETPTSINHVHFAALSSRLAQVAAKASADAMSAPACAYHHFSSPGGEHQRRSFADPAAGAGNGNHFPIQVIDVFFHLAKLGRFND